MAGKTGTAQVHNDTTAEKQKNFNDMTLPWDERPNALFVGFAPVDAPRYAVAIVMEHGNWGATSAAPIARDLITYALTHDPAGRDTPLNPPAVAALSSGTNVATAAPAAAQPGTVVQ
jgi:penicillin-binding protein 2